MNLYSYIGPVLYFDEVIKRRWTGETYAVSEKKAKSNLRYRFIKETGYSANAKISLPGKLFVSETAFQTDKANQLKINI